MTIAPVGRGYSTSPIVEELKDMQQQGLYRKGKTIQKVNETLVNVEGNNLINFCSNDYLGLSSHPKLKQAINDSLLSGGVGSSASPMISGKTHLHAELEKKISNITGRDKALLFSCGYMANIGVIQALTHSQSFAIFLDKLCHASLIDGVVLSRSKFKRYKHGSMSSLRELMERSSSNGKLVLTESVFSMDGDIAPLTVLSKLCHEYAACLFVDDSHGFGVLGNSGLGAMDEYGLTQTDVPLLMATFGKALGVGGAFVAGKAEMIDILEQRARSYIYSTALPIPVVAAVIAALEILDGEPERRERLRQLIKYFHQQANNMNIKISSSTSHIQPIIIGDANETMRVRDLLEQEGLLVAGIRQPTVPRGTSRLRITLSASHSFEQVNHLFDALKKII
ncbi:MAG: 8-amino-7-oxononanoate synthase [Gammaproteobacteria bacterium]|jgi:8-amino-7-oxononanoate synthase